MKYIFWSIILFCVYRFWYAPIRLNQGRQAEIPQEQDNGEYTDYEEIK